MFTSGLLPDLAPRDSHSLWYTSSRKPFSAYDNHQQLSNADNANASLPHGANPRRNHHIIERSPLARLLVDEQNIERRLQNVCNFGSTWLKPIGIQKTLHQSREERREQEEHQEAMRREQLAQDLAEAEAADFEEDVMDDVQLDGAQDLDDDIPDADDDFGESDGSEEDDHEGDNAEDDDDDGDGGADLNVTGEVRRDAEDGQGDQEQRVLRDEQQRILQTDRDQQQLIAQRMAQTGDAFQENATLSGNGSAYYGDQDVVDEEDQAEMIEETDEPDGEMNMDIDMDADLDDDIPEAPSSGAYEHTDTEADISSIYGDQDFASARPSHATRFRTSLARSDATRNSIGVSDLLSRDGSSYLDSSPNVPRNDGGAEPSLPGYRRR